MEKIIVYESAAEAEIAKILYDELDMVACDTCSAPGTDWCWNCERLSVAWHISEKEAQRLAKKIVEKMRTTEIGKFYEGGERE